MRIVVGIEPRVDNELVNANDAARYLGVTKKQLFSKTSAGRIRSFKIRSGDPRFPYYNLYPKCDLDAYRDRMNGPNRRCVNDTKQVANTVVEMYNNYHSIPDIALGVSLPVARVRDILHRRVGNPLPPRRNITKSGIALRPSTNQPTLVV